MAGQLGELSALPLWPGIRAMEQLWVFTLVAPILHHLRRHAHFFNPHRNYSRLRRSLGGLAREKHARVEHVRSIAGLGKLGLSGLEEGAKR